MEAITGFLEDFDFARLLPEIGEFLSSMRFWTGVLMVLGPAVLLGLGLWYFLRPVQMPDEKHGFRLKHAMGSVKAWQYTQRMAALVYMILGGAMLVISIVICLICLGVREMSMMSIAVIWLLIQVILVIVGLSVIRNLVSKHFDSNGAPIK